MSSFYIKVYPISLHSFITISFHILPCDKRVWKNEICFLTKTSIVACCIKVSKKSKYLEKTGKIFFFWWSTCNFWWRIFFNKNWQNLCSFEGKKYWNCSGYFLLSSLKKCQTILILLKKLVNCVSYETRIFIQTYLTY